MSVSFAVAAFAAVELMLCVHVLAQEVLFP